MTPETTRLPARTSPTDLEDTGAKQVYAALTPEQTDEVFEQYGAGHMTLQEIAAEIGGSVMGLRAWIHRDPTRKDAWVLAKQARAEVMADATVTIADATEPDPDAIALSSLQVKARQWRTANLDPRGFGKAPDVVVGIQQTFLTATKEVNAADTAIRMAVLGPPPDKTPDVEILEDTPRLDDLLS